MDWRSLRSFPVGAPLGAQSLTDQRTIEDIQKALVRLPYYGVFDFLTLQYERGTVTLSGFVYRRA